MSMNGITNLLPPEKSGVAAVLAGADIVLCARVDSSSSYPLDMLQPLRDGLLAAAQDGTLAPERIDASVRRVLTAKTRYAVRPVGEVALASVNGASHLRAVIELLAAVAATSAATGKP
jgi:beta-glucosidase-like glycosyl hydrolase